MGKGCYAATQSYAEVWNPRQICLIFEYSTVECWNHLPKVSRKMVLSSQAPTEPDEAGAPVFQCFSHYKKRPSCQVVFANLSSVSICIKWEPYWDLSKHSFSLSKKWDIDVPIIYVIQWPRKRDNKLLRVQCLSSLLVRFLIDSLLFRMGKLTAGKKGLHVENPKHTEA